jgi:hypothetical protein
MAGEGWVIRRVVRGVYYCPRYSDLLKKTVMPDIDRIPARKNVHFFLQRYYELLGKRRCS